MAEYNYIIPTGVIVPDTSDIQAQVEAEYKEAFGEDISIDPSTPQGVLIQAEVLARSNVVRNNAALANQINPNLAGGVFLDALLALTGSERVPAVRSTVTGILIGTTGTIIPAGSQVRDSAHNEIFESLSTATLTGGQASVVFRAINDGAISVGIGTLNKIITPVLGWEQVSNTTAGTVGTPLESDASARSLRNNTLAAQGSALPEAIISAVYLVEGVKSLVFRENYTDVTQIIDGVTLLPHSIYLCVQGGDDIDVATAIFSKKSAGANYNGNTVVNLYDPYSMVTYPVKFDRPTSVPVLVRVYVSVNTSVSDPQTSVVDAILKYVAGEIPGEPGLIVGASVSSFEIAGAINSLYPGIFVHKVETTTNIVDQDDFSSDEIPIAINQIATIEASSITVITS